ncbi:MAG TPA: hypothetical protein VFB36_10810 [Nevskiaceae bacterium]|nr:hypothetical protein [Nevskiaceae bacterium]
MPPDLVQFLHARIDSVPELEALLLMHGNPAVAWDSGALAERLYVSVRESALILAKLARLGLVTAAEGHAFRFDRASGDAATVERLAQSYQKHLSMIARIIHDKPALGLREFAQAFTVKRRED